MNYLTPRKIVIITKQTRADEMIKRFNNLAQAEFYVEKMGGEIQEYLREDQIYKTAVSDITNAAQALARIQKIEREYVPNYIFGKDDIVIVVGPDGLVVNTLKYLDGQDLIAVNPDPTRYDGILLPFRKSDVTHVVREVVAKQRRSQEITMALATLNDGQNLLAVNDFFIGRKTHVSARYNLAINGKQEDQSSSGIIVSTGLGSSGWLKSVITGAKGIAGNISGQRITGSLKNQNWNSDYLYYSVREPFPSQTTGTTLVFGKITANLEITSYMPESGVIFSDGIEQDFLEFNSGIKAKISLADKKGYLIV